MTVVDKKQVVVGLLRNPRMVAKIANQRPPVSAMLNIDAAEQAGVFSYYFQPADVDLGKQQICGWVRSAQGIWNYEAVPWPNVLYDRGVRFSKHERAQVRAVRSLLRRTCFRINNTTNMNKLTCKQVANRDYITQDLHPYTVLFLSYRDLLDMTARFSTILVKPLRGRKSKGMSMITDLGQGMYAWEPVNGVAKSPLTYKQVVNLIREHLFGRRFLLQQHVNLMRVNGKRADIRVLMCKDGRGLWKCVRDHMWVFREKEDPWARPEDCEAITLRDALDSLFDSAKAEDIYRQIMAMSVTLAKNTEMETGPMGELGLDFGLDAHSRLWFFEVNVLPEKDPEPCDPLETVPEQFSCIMEYAKFLARSL